LWGHIKNTAFAERIRNINHLKERTEAAIRSITLDLLQVFNKLHFFYLTNETPFFMAGLYASEAHPGGKVGSAVA
jgi:putative SOS response-associated peptidase YedK